MTMLFEPKDVFRKMEFDKVLELLEKEALTEMSAQEIRELSPQIRFDDIDTRLREVREFKLALEKNERFPIDVYADVRPDLRMLDIIGYTLQAESF